MIPYSNYPFQCYSYSSSLSNQIPFNFMTVNQPFYLFFDNNFGQPYQSLPSNSESLLRTQEPDIKRNIHILKKESSVEDQRCLQEAPRLLHPITQNEVQNSRRSNKIEKCQKDEKNDKVRDYDADRPELSRFVRKNTQSNVVNQIFSFMWSLDKNIQYLHKILADSKKINIFIAIMRNVKIKCKSQLNRFFLRELMSVQQWHMAFKKIMVKIRDVEVISEEELTATIRRLCHIYLREISRYSIMTSKKMNQKLWGMHFQKCRQIQDFLFKEKIQ